MQGSLSLAKTHRPAPATAVRSFQAQIRDLLDPDVLYPHLVAALADLLEGPPILLFLPDPYRGGYLLRAAVHAPAGLIGTLRLDARVLPPALRLALGSDGSRPPPRAAAPVRLRRRIPGLEEVPPALAAPLLDAARPFGFLFVGRRPDGARYTAADLALLAALADPAVTAVRAADLSWKYGRSLQQLQTLNRLGEELSANLDIEAVCLIVYDQLKRALDFDSFFVARYDEELAMLTFPFSVDAEERYFPDPMPLGTGLATSIFETGRPLVVDDLTLGVAHLQIPHTPDPYGSPRRSRSWMGVPMIAKHRTIGVLSVQSYTPNLYRHEQVQFLSTVANQVASALENSRLFTERERRIAELSTLNEISQRISGSLRMGDLIHILHEQLAAVLDATHLCIAVQDPATGDLKYTFFGAGGGAPGGRPLLAGVLEWIITNRAPLCSSRDLIPTLVILGIDVTGLDLRSFLGVPLLVGDNMIGALAAYSLEREGAYDYDHLRLLTTIAGQVGVVIQNARLYERTDTALSTRVAQLLALEEIARLLNASLDLTRIINLVLVRAVETTGAGAAIMALFDPALQALRLLGHIGYPPAVIAEYMEHPVPISRGIIGRAMRENRTLLVSDVMRDPDNIPVLSDIRCQLVVLVRRGGQAIGVLSLESPDADTFSAEQVDFIEHLAEHAAIAVDNARRYDRERRQNELLMRRTGEMAAILQIGNALKADLPLEALLTQVAEGVRSSLGFNIAMLSLLEEGPPRYFRRVAAAGLDPATWDQLRARPSPYEEGLRLMDPRFQISQSYFISHLYNVVTHLESYYRPDLGARAPQEWHPDDMLIVPLRGKGGQVVGTMSVDDPVDRQLPSRTTIETLEIFANQAVIALENARLFDEQRLRLRERALLQELGVGLAATLDPLELLREVARSAVQLFEVWSSLVVLLDDPTNPAAITGAVACEQHDGQLEVKPYPRERLTRLLDEVLTSPGFLIVPDTAVTVPPRPGLLASGIRSVLGTQLRAGNQPLGALFLLGREPRAFANHEQQLLQIFAAQVAVAMQNARLFESENHRLRDVTSLQDLGLRLTATLDINTLLEETVQLARQLLDANSSDILLVDADGQQALNVRCWAGADGTIQWEAGRSALRVGGLTDTVMRSGKPLSVADTLDDPRINPITRAEGVRSLIAVPIRVTDQTLGVLFVNDYQPRAFAAHEQQLLQVFTNQVAVAIQNARLFEERHAFEQRLVSENARMGRELVTARATQRQLLPEMPRHLAGLAIHGLCLPAMEVGGDYFDVVPLIDGRLVLALGDVTGKGTSAVMLMAMIKTALFSQVSTDPHPWLVLDALNKLAVEFMQGQLMTFFYAVYDPRSREVLYGNAGHLYPYIRRLAGALETLTEGGLPLGAGPELVLDVGSITLAPGDLLVLFSDGIVEAMDDQRALFSFERLETLLSAAAPAADPRLLVEDIVDRVHAFAGGAPQDDVTLLVARVDPLAPA